jgi:aminoglycoside 6'-N-acetyltransferase
MPGSISFRPLERSDFPLLQAWLAAPHVAAWWTEPLDRAGVEAKYGPRVDGAEPTHVFVAEQEGRPFAWIQWYRWADYPEHARQLGAAPSSAGIDVAIGRLEMTGLGLGPVTIRAFLEQFVFTNPAICAVITDPEESNLRSLRAFKKAGFREVKTVQLVGECSKRQVMRLDRP